MKRNKPTVSMKNAAKEGLDLINSGEFPVTGRAVEVGKKIASGQDLDDNHVQDMAHFHASHDTCPKDCEDLLWGGPAGEMWAKGKMVQSMNTSLAEEKIDFNKIISDKDLNLSLEIYSDIKLEEPEEETDDGLIWAPIARSGMLATRPGPGGEKLDSPLVFIPGRSNDQRKEIGLQDLCDAFDDKAIEYVTIPLSHENKVLENTGYIKQVKISDSKKIPGEKVLLAGHKFTEPDVKGKVERGTIPSRSSGILYDYKNTTTGKVYPVALDHVCLTPKPWMGGMEPYGSADLGDRTIVPMLLSEKPFSINIENPIERVLPTKLAQENTTSHQQKKEEIQSEFLADIVWGDKPSFRNIEKQVEEILCHMSGNDEDSYPKYYLLDVSDDKVLIKVNYGIGPDQDAWVVPYTLDNDGNLKLAQFPEWVDASKKWVTDTIDPEKDKAELDKLKMSEEEIKLATLTSKARKDLPSSAFVYPSDERYPIHDIAHARNALARVDQNGSSEEQSKVRSAVYRKYPELKKNKESSTKMSDPLKEASARRLGSTELDNNQPIGGPMTLLALSEEKMELLGLSDEAKEFQRLQNKEIEKLNLKLAESQKAEKETGTANKIAKYKEEGFESFPGLLREFEVTALSDDGDIALKLELSENGHTTKTPETATQLAERFMRAIPRKDGKVDLGEFANKLETTEAERPDLKPAETEADKKVTTGDELLEQMLAADPTLAKDSDFLALSQNGKGK